MPGLCSKLLMMKRHISKTFDVSTSNGGNVAQIDSQNHILSMIFHLLLCILLVLKHKHATFSMIPTIFKPCLNLGTFVNCVWYLLCYSINKILPIHCSSEYFHFHILSKMQCKERGDHISRPWQFDPNNMNFKLTFKIRSFSHRH